MAYLAPIVPPGSEHLLPPETQRVFCFADIAAQNMEYLLTFENRTGVVLDNQIYEGLPPCTPAVFAAVARQINPVTIILPDSRDGTNQTLAMAEKYLDKLSFDQVQRTYGVLQGKTFEDLERCAKGFNDLGLFRYAIPVRLPGRPSRLEVWNALRCQSWGAKWHFLGMDYPYWDEMACAPYVESMDTAEATTAAYYFKGLHEVKRPHNFNELGTDLENPDRRTHLWRNIRKLQDLIATKEESAVLATLRQAESSS